MPVLLATLRGAGVHGDQDDGTFTFEQTPTLATPPTPASYDTLPLNTGSVDNSADLGTITHLIFFCRVRVQNPLAGADIAAITNQLIKWQSPSGTPDSAIPASPGFPNNVWASARTSDITSKPTGGAWTWDAVNGLVLVGISATFLLEIEPVAFYVGELDLADVWVEIWGDAPAPGSPLLVKVSGNVDKVIGSGITEDTVKRSGATQNAGRGEVLDVVRVSDALQRPGSGYLTDLGDQVSVSAALVATGGGVVSEKVNVAGVIVASLPGSVLYEEKVARSGSLGARGSGVLDDD